MVKSGQRKFLKNNGYTDADLDTMSPSRAKELIADYENKALQRRIYQKQQLKMLRKDQLASILSSKGFDKDLLNILEEYFKLGE